MSPDPTPSEIPSEASPAPLAGRVALVTGASRGIGLAIARRLAARGASVACVATTAENAAAGVRACAEAGPSGSPGEDGPRYQAYGVDVADHAAVGELVQAVLAELGGLDILINNAGLTRDQLLLRMSEEDFDRVIDVNLKGAFNFCRAAARPLMKARGRIVSVSSVVGLQGNAGQANYAASKAGLIGLTRSLAKELAGRGVCVNAVAPGYIETDMTAGIDQKAAAELAASIPLGRIGKAEEIAAAVEYLVGPGGSYVTGQVIVVDGGLSI